VILQDPSSQLLQSTVRDEIAFASRNLDVPAEVVDRECDRWITRFGLGDLLDLDPASLSAGRQQLVLIAGALAARPSLLIADEPGAHLDQESRLLVLEALAQERGKGLALVWASQDPGELAAADRILAMGEEGAHIAPEEEPTPMHDLAAPGFDEALLELRVAPRTGLSGPRVETVEGFVLRIGTHRIEAITGPNGTGKSVLLASAAGLEAIPQVAVSWKQDRPWPPILVAQYPERLFFEEVVRDEVAFAACSRGVDRSQALGEAQRCFDRLNLESDLMTRRLWELSGGMRRLVEVVAALIAPACLVALDEPTAGLDRERREGLAELVRERAGSSAVLIASQDLRWLGRVGARLTPIGHATVSKTPSISKKTD
jgi:energy-coupling factor transporter ATP-binding protein EcfA2